jgi:hypothetical protein
MDDFTSLVHQNAGGRPLAIALSLILRLLSLTKAG